MIKALSAAVLLAFAPIAIAQSASESTPPGSRVGGVDITKCTAMMGAERVKCLREERSSSSASAGTTATTPGIATTTPAPLTTPSSPTNPTMLPGASTTPSGK